MANFDPTHKSNRGTRPALQLTSSQLIMTICALLVLGAALIVLGMLLKQWEYSLQQQSADTGLEQQPGSPDDGRVASSLPRAAGQGRQISPRSFFVEEEPVEQEQPRAIAPSRGFLEGVPRFVEVPAPQSEEAIPVEGSRIGRAEPEGNGGGVLNGLTWPSTEESVIRRTNAQPADRIPHVSLEETTGEEQPQQEEAGPIAASAETASISSLEAEIYPIYSVQIAAFSSRTRSKAEEFARLHSDLNPELVLSEDGNYIRVLVGRFAERQTAVSRQEELKKTPALADCFIQVRK